MPVHIVTGSLLIYPFIIPISYEYDAAGNVTKVTDPMGGQTKYAYNENGQLTKVTDALGFELTYTYTAAGDLKTKTRVGESPGRSQKTTNTYDKNGNLLSVTDPMGNQARYAYDPLGRKIKATEKDGSSTEF